VIQPQVGDVAPVSQRATALQSTGKRVGRGMGPALQHPALGDPQLGCCLPADLPGRGWVPGGEQGDGTRARSTQKPLPTPSPAPPDRFQRGRPRLFSDQALFSAEGLLGFITSLQIHTRQIPAQTPALFQAAENKRLQLYLPLGESHQHKIIIKNEEMVPPLPPRAAAGNVSSRLPAQPESSKLGFLEKGLAAPFRKAAMELISAAISLT